MCTAATNYGGARPLFGAWTAAKAIEEIDQHGIEVSIISRTSGETEEGGEGPRLRRKSNEFAAKVVSDNPKRFGFFANISYSDPDGALKELDYAYGTLKADGVSLLSSIGDKWPGDPAFDAVFDELNRRKAILFLHPLTSKCCRNLFPVARVLSSATSTPPAPSPICSIPVRSPGSGYPLHH